MIEPYPKLSGRVALDRWTWETRYAWPPDSTLPPARIFIGNAIDKVGQALFGSEWNGREPEGAPYKSLPLNWEDASQDDKKNFPPERWGEAVAGREEHRRLAEASHKRLYAVWDTLSEALRAGKFRTHVRGMKGTHFTDVDPIEWNVDRDVMAKRFQDLTMTWSASFMHTERGWIFFDQASFSLWLKKLAEPGTRHAGGRSSSARQQQKHCAAWLYGTFEMDLGRKSGLTQDDLFETASTMFSELSRRQFNEAWNEAIEKGGGRFGAWTNDSRRATRKVKAAGTQ